MKFKPVLSLFAALSLSLQPVATAPAAAQAQQLLNYPSTTGWWIEG